MDAVGTVNVGVTRRPEHHGIALGLAAEAVRRRIGVVIGLDLDDPAADAVDQQRRPDQIGRDLMNAAGEKRPMELRRGHRMLQCGCRLWRGGNI